MHKNGSQVVKLPAMQTSLNDDVVQSLGLIETIHDHEPIDDLAIAAEALSRTHQRDEVAIGVGGETPIDPELGPASRLAAGEREVLSQDFATVLTNRNRSLTASHTLIEVKADRRAILHE